ncbi:MAG: hypothetical protein Q9174_003885 [Haloplaca sp. 1 TL-2023]
MQRNTIVPPARILELVVSEDEIDKISNQIPHSSTPEGTRKILALRSLSDNAGLRAMRLFLIRHGETVDNVAQLYAGSRDSALTVQGVLQAERLGQHLASLGNRFTDVFASDLQRAVKTAEALRAAQIKDDSEPKAAVQQVQELREQDFGFYEGKPFYARQRDSTKTGKDSHRSEHTDDPDFQDVETKESMTARTDAFISKHLLPKLKVDGSDDQSVIAIVSHGIILSHLWRSLLGLFHRQTLQLTLGPNASLDGGGVINLEYLGGWSNTGYLELDIWAGTSISEAPLSHCRMLIRTVNGKEHLKGLKRARGVGSSQYDEGQKKIDTFFKKTNSG